MARATVKVSQDGMESRVAKASVNSPAIKGQLVSNPFDPGLLIVQLTMERF